MLVKGAEVAGLAADRRLNHVNVFRIANRRCDRLIHFHDLSRPGQERDELGDLCFRQRKALEKSRVVKNSLNFVKHGTRENNPVSAFKKLQ